MNSNSRQIIISALLDDVNNWDRDTLVGFVRNERLLVVRKLDDEALVEELLVTVGEEKTMRLFGVEAQEELDELVRTLHDEQASDINNGGIAEQVYYLVNQGVLSTG